MGDWVIAIGSPFGLDQTVTAGIISAKGRSTVGLAEYEDFLQTDAPINPGNSGGPLLNLRGEIIGINTAIASRSGASTGVGFAIPGRLVQRVARSLISDGHVERGQIGVVVQSMSQELAETFSYDGQGVVVVQLMSGGTAEKAGLQAGDIVTEINHRSVRHPSDVRNVIANTDPGTEVMFSVFRNGQKQEMAVEVGSRDTEPEDNQSLDSDEHPLNPDRLLGLTFEGQKQFGKPSKSELTFGSGCEISGIEPGSPGQRAGLQIGDVVVSADGQLVNSSKDLSDVVGNRAAERPVRLLILRKGIKLFVVVKPDTD